MISINDEAQTDVRPRVILLTQWFDPEPTFKGLVFARALHARGFNVEVVTGFPNYPGGKVYDGYKISMVSRQIIDGINVTRLPLFPSHDRSALRRMLNYLSFLLSSMVYLIFFARRADILYAYHPPLTVAVAAVLAKVFRRTPIVLDIQDMWPDTLKATGMINSPLILGAVARCCNWIYRRVDKIAVLSPGFRLLLSQRGVSEEKICIIYNWADESSISAPRRDNPVTMGDAGKFKVLFAGNMGRAQGLDTVLDAALILSNAEPDIQIYFLGDGIDLERLRTRVEAENIQNVRFLPKVPMDEVGQYLSAADCLLVHLRADPLFEITIPSKTQAYMAAGKPIIMGVAGDAAKLIHDSGGGIVVKPEDEKELALAVRDLHSRKRAELIKMGNAGRDYYFSNLDIAHGAAAFTALFSDTIRIGRA